MRLSSYCRQYPRGLYNHIGEQVVCAKGRSNCHDMGTKGITSQVQEHIDMVKSIRGEGPYINHGMAVAESTMACIMARESAYSGQEITWEQAMNSPLDLMPKAFDYDLKMDMPPLPVAGVYKLEDAAEGELSQEVASGAQFSAPEVPGGGRSTAYGPCRSRGGRKSHAAGLTPGG